MRCYFRSNEVDQCPQSSLIITELFFLFLLNSLFPLSFPLLSSYSSLFYSIVFFSSLFYSIVFFSPPFISHLLMSNLLSDYLFLILLSVFRILQLFCSDCICVCRTNICSIKIKNNIAYNIVIIFCSSKNCTVNVILFPIHETNLSQS